MAESATKLAVKTEEKAGEPVSALQAWRPFESLFHEVDRLFQGFDRDFLHSPFRRSVLDIEPFWRRQLIWGLFPLSTSSRRTMPTKSRPSCRASTKRTSR